MIFSVLQERYTFSFQESRPPTHMLLLKRFIFFSSTQYKLQNWNEEDLQLHHMNTSVIKSLWVQYCDHVISEGLHEFYLKAIILLSQWKLSIFIFL